MDSDFEIVKDFILSWIKNNDTDQKIKKYLDSIFDIQSNSSFPALGIKVKGIRDTEDKKRLFPITLRIFVFGNQQNSEKECSIATEHIYKTLKKKPVNVSYPKGYAGIHNLEVDFFEGYQDSAGMIFVGDINFNLKIQ